MNKPAEIVRKKFVKSSPGAVRLLSERVAQRSRDLIEELIERNRRHIQFADVPVVGGDMFGDRMANKHRPLQDKSLPELLALSARLQEHAASLTEKTRALVESVQDTRAVIEHRVAAGPPPPQAECA